MRSPGVIAISAALLLTFGFASQSRAADTTPPPSTDRTPPAIAALRPWAGDWDGIVERRVLRVLVVYSRTFYFVDQGTQRGLTYEAFKGFEDAANRKLGKKALRFHVAFIPVARDELIPALRDGRGDVAAANLTITQRREKLVDFSAPTYTNVDELIVTGPNSPRLGTVDDLSGQAVYARKSSSYREHLEALNVRLAARGAKPVNLVAASENLEDEDLLEMVNAGLLPAVVVDSHKAAFWKQVFPKIVVHPGVTVNSGGRIAWAIRKNSPLLETELDAFLRSHGKGMAFGNTLLKRYLQNAGYVKPATDAAGLRRFDETVALFRKYGDRYDMDYLLMMAQGYQESRLDQNAKSQVGAVGVMQVMPATAGDLKVGDIRQLDPNIHAGVKYIRHMIDHYYANDPMTPVDKMLFAFASYNAGPNRIEALRREAARRGLDPNRWFRNVEFVAAEKIGQETVTYVANIYKYYIAYQLVVGSETRRNAAREALKQNTRR